MKFLNILTPLFLLLALSGCLGTKHLQENQLLLAEQEIKGNEVISSSALDDFYRQEPNIRFPLIPWAPYVSLYYLGENFYDKEKIRRKRNELEERYNEKIQEAEEAGRDTRAERLREKKRDKIESQNKKLDEGNLLMRTGEPIVVYDSSLIKETARQMEQFLHSKGFFHGEVEYEVDKKNQKAYVTYLVEENKPFIIDSLSLTVPNENIRRLILETKQESFIDSTQRYDQEDLSRERTRIDNLLKNNGYYEFSPQYIEFFADTTLGNRRVAIETRIFQPADRGYHKQFKIDSVIFTTDATTRGDLRGRQSRIYNNIIYRFFEEEYSKSVLDNRVFIRPDSLYSRQRTLETQRQLGNLDIFKFINVTYDTSGGQFNAMIYTSPLKKYQTSNEIGFTYSQGIPGPYFNSTWSDRNVFGGLEILQLNLRAGVEGVPGTTNPDAAYASQQAGANLSLTFPQFVAPIPKKLAYRLGKLNPKTRALLGVAHTDRPEFIRQTINSSITYSWQTQSQRRDNFYSTLYNFSPLDVSLIYSNFKENAEGNNFERLLREWQQQGNPFIRTFDQSFVSSMYAFAVFNKNNYGTYEENSRFIRPYLESGGTSQNLIDFGFAKQEGELQKNEFRAFRFLKFSNDYRQFYQINESNGLAWRLNAGVAVPYGADSATLPYEKFYFAGGSNSIRAFEPRRLGPGVYTPPIENRGPLFTNEWEQPGEIILEGSFEYRHNIFGFLNGAIFLDFGNVWRIEESEALPGAEFKIDEFYKQIALGTGYGFRFDFSFLILRLDLGLKLYNPQAVTLGEDGYNYSEGWMLKHFSDSWSPEMVELNIGIGYPF